MRAPTRRSSRSLPISRTSTSSRCEARKAPSRRAPRASAMLWVIAKFEAKKRFGMLSTYVYFAVLFACAFLIEIAAGGAFSSVSVGMGSEKVYANAPFALHGFIGVLSHFGVLISAAVFGQAVHQ